jgi:hypothetical protein
LSILAEGIDRFIREAPDGRFLRADRPLATLPDMSTERFPIRVGKRSRLLLRIGFGVTPDNAWVDVGDAPDGEIHVSFGRFHFRAFVANVTRWRIEGPWAWITAIGVRMSIRHHDLSFDGSHHGGVRMDFRTPVRWTIFRVPAIYVSADDLEGLAAALTARGIPGEDARRG